MPIIAIHGANVINMEGTQSHITRFRYLLKVYTFICGMNCRCSCNDDGYVGADCSLKDCPYGLAWSDQPIAEDEAHQLATCSNRGVCDFDTGECRCLDGFTGHACERLDCPNNCTGNGKCMTMLDRAKHYRYSLLALEAGPFVCNYPK